MRKNFLSVIDFLERAFRELEATVPPPKWVELFGQRHARYEERMFEQAIVQKLARMISGLKALDLLLQAGLAQDQGATKRILDELHEDILFLVCGKIKEEWGPSHESYLEGFWTEEFDHPEPLKSTQKRVQVPRKKVRAANARSLAGDDPHTAGEIERTLYNAYSGYVHGASPAIMEMCGGDPPSFMFEVPRNDCYSLTLINDAWNYFYRSLISIGMIAKAFGNETLGGEIYRAMFEFERETGRKYSDPLPNG